MTPAKILNRPSSHARWSRAREVAAVADDCGVQRSSVACLAALSCVFEDPRSEAEPIGRKVFKPKEVYSDQAAFNALSDLRQIEIAAIGQSRPELQFALATCDLPMARLWSALVPRGEMPEDGPELTFDLDGGLFQALDEQGVSDLSALLAST